MDDQCCPRDFKRKGGNLRAYFYENTVNNDDSVYCKTKPSDRKADLLKVGALNKRLLDVRGCTLIYLVVHDFKYYILSSNSKVYVVLLPQDAES